MIYDIGDDVLMSKDVANLNPQRRTYDYKVKKRKKRKKKNGRKRRK